MLTLFPIMFLSLIAHALLRLITGLILVALGARRLSTAKAALHRRVCITVGVVELVLGAALALGFLTQLAALGMILLSIAMLTVLRRFSIEIPSRAFYVLLIGIALSLFITGAGAFAIDLPF